MDTNNPQPYVMDMEDQPMDRKEQERLLDQLERRYAASPKDLKVLRTLRRTIEDTQRVEDKLKPKARR